MFLSVLSIVGILLDSSWSLVTIRRILYMYLCFAIAVRCAYPHSSNDSFGIGTCSSMRMLTPVLLPFVPGCAFGLYPFGVSCIVFLQCVILLLCDVCDYLLDLIFYVVCRVYCVVSCRFFRHSVTHHI